MKLNLPFLRLTGQLIISVVVLVVWGYLQFFLLQNTPPGQNHDLILRMLGTLDGALMLVLAFWFSSTVGSQAKDVKPTP